MIVDVRMDGGELLERLHLSKSQHRPLSSSKRKMRVLCSIVQPPAHLTSFEIA